MSSQSPDTKPTNLPKENGGQSLWSKLFETAKAHYTSILAWLIPNGIAVADQYTTKLLPISSESKPFAMLAMVLIGIFLSITATVLVTQLVRIQNAKILHWVLIACVLCSLVAIFGWYELFLSAEYRWKMVETSDEDAESLFKFWEPLYYGMTFAFVGVFAIFSMATVNELHRHHHALKDKSVKV